jgi:hypothetical protein
MPARRDGEGREGRLTQAVSGATAGRAPVRPGRQGGHGPIQKVRTRADAISAPAGMPEHTADFPPGQAKGAYRINAGSSLVKSVVVRRVDSQLLAGPWLLVRPSNRAFAASRAERPVRRAAAPPDRNGR